MCPLSNFHQTKQMREEKFPSNEEECILELTIIEDKEFSGWRIYIKKIEIGNMLHK